MGSSQNSLDSSPRNSLDFSPQNSLGSSPQNYLGSSPQNYLGSQQNSPRRTSLGSSQGSPQSSLCSSEFQNKNFNQEHHSETAQNFDAYQVRKSRCYDQNNDDYIQNRDAFQVRNVNNNLCFDDENGRKLSNVTNLMSCYENNINENAFNTKNCYDTCKDYPIKSGKIYKYDEEIDAYGGNYVDKNKLTSPDSFNNLGKMVDTNFEAYYAKLSNQSDFTSNNFQKHTNISPTNSSLNVNLSQNIIEKNSNSFKKCFENISNTVLSPQKNNCLKNVSSNKNCLNLCFQNVHQNLKSSYFNLRKGNQFYELPSPKDSNSSSQKKIDNLYEFPNGQGKANEIYHRSSSQRNIDNVYESPDDWKPPQVFSFPDDDPTAFAHFIK